MDHDISNVGKPHTYLNLLEKYCERIIDYWLRKVTTDTVNWEELFIHSRTANNAIYRDSLTVNNEIAIGTKYGPL